MQEQAVIEALLAQTLAPLVQPLKTYRPKITVDLSTGTAVTLNLGFPAQAYVEAWQAQCIDALRKLGCAEPIAVTVTQAITGHSVQGALEGLPGVKNVIAIASGKGGVGKSTCTANLALACAKLGARVGVLDADIYGPSMPQMLGATERPTSVDGTKLSPVICHGLQTMSIGYLIDETDTPMIWRGPMVTGALQQLLADTEWDELDYLFVDLPPGTGDIQLTLAQKVPVSGAVIVTTPQDIALLDASKAYNMFDKVQISVLGVVENMAVHVCSACGHQEHIFGQDGGRDMAEHYSIPLLGEVPLAKSIREQADIGKPTVVAEPDGAITQSYLQIALQMTANLAQQSKNYTRKFPKIVVEQA